MTADGQNRYFGLTASAKASGQILSRHKTWASLSVVQESLTTLLCSLRLMVDLLPMQHCGMASLDFELLKGFDVVGADTVVVCPEEDGGEARYAVKINMQSLRARNYSILLATLEASRKGDVWQGLPVTSLVESVSVVQVILRYATSEVAELPKFSPTSCEEALTIWEAAKKYQLESLAKRADVLVW